jgi:ectoine hydroxylase-related dioxygenase (phytanoyl-CoA dioxygenase family)
MGGSNPGLIWLDESFARRDISLRARSGEITAAEEANLAKFAADGYFVIKIALSEDDAKAIDRDVNRLWSTKLENVAFAYDSPPKRFSDAVESSDRKPRYRIHELHAASEQALQLYLHPVLHRYASLILGETAVATQSLYFEFGSQQALHRDSTVVPTPQFGRLVAAWIALEDISPESGPLAYVPGSQRFPFYDFGSGDYTYDPSRHSAADVAAAMAFYSAELERSGLPVHQFNATRGEVLIWHSALMHGGSAPVDEHRTRKSFVVHYSTRSSQRSRECAVSEANGESVFTTSQILERAGAYGFANPLDGDFLYRR